MALVLAETGLPAHALCLEITERVLLQDSSATADIIASLRERGVRIVLDDFGTGYSSLSYLQRFSLDILKIDRSFVSGLDERIENRVIVEAIIMMAHAFGLDVTAEGVETPEQLQALRELGCANAQGYLPHGQCPPQTSRSCCATRRPDTATPPGARGRLRRAASLPGARLELGSGLRSSRLILLFDLGGVLLVEFASGADELEEQCELLLSREAARSTRRWWHDRSQADLAGDTARHPRLRAKPLVLGDDVDTADHLAAAVLVDSGFDCADGGLGSI